ncbi:transmembrane 4 L6 family member 20 [Vicugna pacos]|uniref:Transmembrane 4 L6 family member 20 n=1 Tax=Vicugna pacos TaxID=30538 RepID=A0A6I9IDR4_VICPA|nr:transmembrane 4 L6 family member 20 isoform X2 [Vicugna pacos]XP_015097872.1 transmembrane 4 L6 family member 20 isoform X2 [Vicugna pacos]
MTCCEGWTACNGFSLLVLLLLGVTLNAIPLIVNLVDEDHSFQNPISCFEWWFPGIIGAGLMVIPATTMSLAARKRACCNNKTGMFLSSLLNVITVIGAAYCLLVSVQALSEGPLICNSQGNSTSTCEFSFNNLTAYRLEPFNLQWFFNDSCVSPTDFNTQAVSDPGAWGGGRRYTLHFNSTENRHRIIHFSVFLGLLLVGILELLFGLSQIIIGFLGCLCGGVSKRRGRIV